MKVSKVRKDEMTTKQTKNITQNLKRKNKVSKQNSNEIKRNNKVSDKLTNFFCKTSKSKEKEQAHLTYRPKEKNER